MAVIVKQRILATDITGEFAKWFNNPKQPLPVGFTSRLLENAVTTIEQINSKNESTTSVENTSYLGINRISALFQSLFQNNFALEFDLQKNYVHERRHPHHFANFKATGNSPTHFAEITFKATCGNTDERLISAVYIKAKISKK